MLCESSLKQRKLQETCLPDRVKEKARTAQPQGPWPRPASRRLCSQPATGTAGVQEGLERPSGIRTKGGTLGPRAPLSSAQGTPTLLQQTELRP